MADRTTVDLTERRERIESLRSDSAWKALSMSRRISLLLDEYLDLLENSSQQNTSDGSENVDAANFLKKLINSQKPSKKEMALVAKLLEIKPDKLAKFCDRLLEVWEGAA